MKRYYSIIVGIILLVILFVFSVLNLFQPEDDTANEHAIYEMNDNWQVISASSAMKHKDDKGAILPENNPGTTVSLPYKGKSAPGEMVVFQHKIPQEYAEMTMSFYSTESTVRVILNDEVIYQYGVENQRMFGKSPGNRINFVNLPDRIGDGYIRIELTSSYEDVAATLNGVTVSQGDAAILQLIENNLVSLFCCIVILISMVVFLLLGIVCLCTGQKTYGVFWLVALGVDVGLYYLVKTEILSLLYGSRAIYSIGQYMFILLIPIFMLMYLENNLGKLYPKLFMVFVPLVNLNVCVQVILQMNNIYDFADMSEFTAVCFRLIIVIGFILYIKAAIKYRRKEHWIMVMAIAVLMIGELYVIGMNVSANMLIKMEHSQYAMTLFFVMLAIYHIMKFTQDSKAEAEENARMALAASEAKGKFLANMSHEIRTPINAVLGMDEMILRESKEVKIREYAMDIFTAGQTLLSLINDILDISKIESGKMEIIPVNYDVSSLIHDLSNMTQGRAKKKNLHFHVEADHEIPCTLYGDDVRIRQVITNILTNAVKYTKEGDIWFRIRMKKKAGKRVTLYVEVEDTGIGIKEEDLPKLYAEFERIEENRNRNIEGTGLGMSITRQLLQMMGSSLQVESTYGKGSKFYFSLEQDIIEDKPIGDFEQNVQKLAAGYTYAAKFIAPEAEVLVVDDNAINRKVFGNLLNQTQVKITEAGSGAECLELTGGKHFDIIFLDHMMPEMDGIETLKKMKEDSGNLCIDTPIIALTANAISGAREKYLEAGFNDYLSKPIVSDKLEKMLWNYLPKELIKEIEKTDDAQPAQSVVETPSLDQLPVVEGLDWNYAWLHLSDMNLLQTTVEAFYGQITSAAEKLTGCYQEITETGVFDSYRIQVHAMKSLAATIGILPLAGMAKVLEDAAAKGQAETIHSMHKIFINEWNGYQEKLIGVFGIEPPENKAEATDVSIICALLEMLNNAMQDMDFDEADEKMKMIDAYRYSSDVQAQVELLKAAVENLDPEQTKQCVQIIISQLSGQKERAQ